MSPRWGYSPLAWYAGVSLGLVRFNSLNPCGAGRSNTRLERLRLAAIIPGAPARVARSSVHPGANSSSLWPLRPIVNPPQLKAPPLLPVIPREPSSCSGVTRRNFHEQRNSLRRHALHQLQAMRDRRAPTKINSPTTTRSPPKIASPNTNIRLYSPRAKSTCGVFA